MVQLVRHPPSVALVVLDGNELVAVRQSRPGPGATTLELPSGKIEPGETPVAAAARELAEECALAAQKLRPLGTFWAAPAYSTELVHVFEAKVLTEVDRLPLDADEDIEVERLPLEAALGRLSDAGSVAALALWLAEEYR